MKFGQLILRNAIKFVVTRRQILRLTCTKIYFGWGSAPVPAWELTGLPRPPTGFKWPYVLRREWREEREGQRETPVPDWKSEKVATLPIHYITMTHTSDWKFLDNFTRAIYDVMNDQTIRIINHLVPLLEVLDVRQTGWCSSRSELVNAGTTWCVWIVSQHCCTGITHSLCVTQSH